MLFGRRSTNGLCLIASLISLVYDCALTFNSTFIQHSAFVKLKELRENCKTGLEKISNPSLGK
jgi:hypothetical protein